MTLKKDKAVRQFIAAARKGTIGPMMQSAFVLQVSPSSLVTAENFDVLFALQVGASLLLDKPLILVVMPGVPAPSMKIRQAADLIVEADVTTPEGQEKLRVAVEEMKKRVQ